MTRSSFVSGLYELDARQTRARLAQAIEACKTHADWTHGPAHQVLQDAVAEAEKMLLNISRVVIQDLDKALEASLKPPAKTAESPPPVAVAPTRPVLPQRPLRPLGRTS